MATANRKPLSELLSLQGKVAVVTGAAAGIGKAVAYRFAECNASVALIDKSESVHKECEALRKEFNGKNQQFFSISSTIGSQSNAEQLAEQVFKHFGRIDILVNNAGIFPQKGCLEITEAEWDSVLNVNLRGLFFLSTASAKKMKDGGKIVNIGSIDGLHPSGNLCHYDASKGGVFMLTKSLALELAPKNIQVNEVKPGATLTTGVEQFMQNPQAKEIIKPMLDKIPMKKMADPDEIATTVLMFATGLGSYCTGSSLIVDGGLLLK